MNDGGLGDWAYEEIKISTCKGYNNLPLARQTDHVNSTNFAQTQDEYLRHHLVEPLDHRRSG